MNIFIPFFKIKKLMNVIIIAIAASICTFIAGVFHLSMVPSFNTNSTILFLVGGLAQIFWVVPTIRNWGRAWDYTGIAGTAIFVVIWVITRMPDNPITGRGGRIGETAIIVEIFQIAFIVLLAVLISKRKPKKSNKIMSEK
jgi:hypothetical protein